MIKAEALRLHRRTTFVFAPRQLRRIGAGLAVGARRTLGMRRRAEPLTSPKSAK
jgi:hypothetical protein